MEAQQITTTNIPNKTLERLVIYRRLLSQLCDEGRSNVFSHQLARLAGNTPAQVRRDLMVIGAHGSPARGYSVRPLLGYVQDLLGARGVQKIVLVGMGNLGRAVLSYFGHQQSGLEIVSAFDTDEARVGRVIAGVRCLHIDQMEDDMRRSGATLGVVTVPMQQAQAVTDRLVAAGAKGILNFSSAPLHVPYGVAVDDVDIGLKLEKLAYFAG